MRALLENRLFRLLAILLAALLLALGGLLVWRGGGDGVVGRDPGGPFALTDQTGKPVTDRTYRGRIMVVYFGYTFCPDACPTALQAISDALDSLTPAQADQIAPIFITVDPDRDTVPVMAQYVAHFNPRLQGLTGTQAQIDAATKAYRVFAAKGPAGGKDYAVNHSSLIFVMDKDGKFKSFLSGDAKPDAIAARLKTYF